MRWIPRTRRGCAESSSPLSGLRLVCAHHDPFALRNRVALHALPARRVHDHAEVLEHLAVDSHPGDVNTRKSHNYSKRIFCDPPRDAGRDG